MFSDMFSDKQQRYSSIVDINRVYVKIVLEIQVQA